MKLHELQRNTSQASKKRVGRGGKRGKTSGRGHKGQKARAGHSIRPQIRDEIKRYPKLRGYKFNTKQEAPEEISLGVIESSFKAGETVSPRALADKGLLKRKGGSLPRVKILSNGEISKKLTFENCAVSQGARQQIEKAGGSIQ